MRLHNFVEGNTKACVIADIVTGFVQLRIQGPDELVESSDQIVDPLDLDLGALPRLHVAVVPGRVTVSHGEMCINL